MKVARNIATGLALAVVVTLGPAAAVADNHDGDGAPDPVAGDTAALDRFSEAVFDSGFADLAKTFGKRAFTRARRSFALGPHLTGAPGMDLEQNDLDFQLGGGLVLYRFKIDVIPSVDTLKEIVKNRFKGLVKERAKAMIATGQQPTKADMERFARETWEEIKAELLLQLRPKRFEKPGFVLLGELNYQFSAEAFDLRVLAGIGIGPVYLATGPSLHINGGVNLVVPIEISKPMLLSDSLRSPVVQFYVSYELAATGRDELPDRIFVGARFALDII